MRNPLSALIIPAASRTSTNLGNVVRPYEIKRGR